MPKQPAVIIIARHGARLDAADKSWHLSSPTPYDPPLTYGGWTQSRALGLRIASLLDTREQNLNSDVIGRGTGIDHGKTKKKKHKVIVHCSPFQRCVQTSIGISAGLAQYQTKSAEVARSSSRGKSPGTKFPSSPRLHAVGDHRVTRESFRRNVREQSAQDKTGLRVDAFLGEWLSPDYFDMITPPPNSTMMVAGAKADLLRKGEEIDQYSLSPNPTTMRAGSVSLWGSNATLGSSSTSNNAAPATPVVSPPANATAEPQLDVKSLSQALPTRRDRSWSSAGPTPSGRSNPFGRSSYHGTSPLNPDAVRGYTPPAPSYAISPIEPIPKGYVTHARDACVDADYQWDSMRPPRSWGDGGSFGEEWSSMHKRFRRGLTAMVDYYNNGGPVDLDNTDPDALLESVEDDDEDTEIALVLVTHGAGCNALIGALTEQPVLLDVGMASLTMAVRKEQLDNGNATDGIPPRISSPVSTPSDIEKALQHSGLSSIYDMKIVASLEHLRPGTDPTRLSIGSSSPILPASKTIPDSRRRSTLISHASAGAPIETNWSAGSTSASAEPGRGTMNAALGSMRRPSTATITTSGALRNNSVGSASSSTGLWSPSTPPLLEADRDGPTSAPAPKKDSISSAEKLELSPEITRKSSTSENNKLGIVYSNQELGLSEEASKPVDGSSEHDSVSELPSQIPSELGRTLSQRGLWGSKPSGAHPSRNLGPKRRWTVQQEGSG